MELEELKNITKDDFIAHFNEIFFSAQSKRIDLELTAHAHSEENTEMMEKNKENHIFKEVFGGRNVHKVSIDSFKEGFQLHPDVYKQDYAKL